MNRGAALIAVVLVSSTVLPFVALGQTDSNEFSQTFSGGPKEVYVDQSGVTGDFTVTVSTTQVPGSAGQTTILTRERLGPGSEQWIVFRNAGAYDNITVNVTVHGSGQPALSAGNKVDVDVPYIIGSTGGDDDMRCSSVERATSMANPLTNIVDCTPPVGNSVPDKLTATDANETRAELYGSLAAVEESANAANDTRANALAGSEMIALLEAKNRYVRALDNGATEPSARLAAHQWTADNYTRMQSQMLNQWEIQVAELERAWNHAQNSPNVSASSFITADISNPSGDKSIQYNRFTFVNTTVTLANGSTRTVRAPKLHGEYWNPGYSHSKTAVTVDPFTSTPTTQHNDIRLHAIRIAQPYDEFAGGSFVYLDTDPNPYAASNERITSQRQSVNGEINDFVNGTYDAWEAGRINTSDMVDPYMADRNGPGGDYQTWALRSLMSMGHATPQNISEFGQMNVTDLSTGQTHRGILLSDGLPDSGSFTVGNTYDAANLTGPQYVITGSQTVELDGPFSVDSATNASGSNMTAVGYNRVRYRTTNLTEFKQQMDAIEVALAETEARQQRLRNSLNNGSGFGGLFGGGGSINQTIALLVIAALAGAALLN